MGKYLTRVCLDTPREYNGLVASLSAVIYSHAWISISLSLGAVSNSDVGGHGFQWRFKNLGLNAQTVSHCSMTWINILNDMT